MPPQQVACQVVAVEDVVAEDQRATAALDEVLADQEGLGQSLRCRLHRVVETEAPLAAVARQLPETWCVACVEITRISRMPASISVDRG